MWCGTFENQDQNEQKFRINQMNQVLIKMSNPIQTLQKKLKDRVLKEMLFSIVKIISENTEERIANRIADDFKKTFHKSIDDDDFGDDRVKQIIENETEMNPLGATTSTHQTDIDGY